MNITDFLLSRIAEDEAVATEALPDESSAWGARGRYDPARVLAECAAKRAIIGQHADATSWDCTTDEIRCPTLRALADVYKDHPDYQKAIAS